MKCPECDSDNISHQWYGPGRRLRYYCRDCHWGGPTQIPEQREVSDTRKITVGGNEYWIYDRYGHIMIYSGNRGSVEEAMKEIDRELERGKKDVDAGPYTAVLWPTSVEVKGRVFR